MRGLLLLTVSALCPATAAADFIDHFADRSDVGMMKVPRSGEVSILVIPLIVDDLPLRSGFTEEIGAFFDPEAAEPSFSGYFREVSRDRYRPRAVVAPAVHLPSCPILGTFADCKIPRGGGLVGEDADLGAAVELIRDALDMLDEIMICAQRGPGEGRRCTRGGGVDLAAFDRSGPAGAPDGYLDGVLVVSNAPFPSITLPVHWMAALGTIQSEDRALPSFVYGSLTAGGIGIAANEDPKAAVHVALHEFGHLLGFLDLYNEANTTEDLPYSLMGGWDYARYPPRLDPFSAASIGWANLLEVDGELQIALPTSLDGGPILKVGRGPEHFFVEHRARGRWIDGDLAVDSGVIVQRVRLQKLPSPEVGRFIGTLQRCANCARWDPLTQIEQADGRHDLELHTANRDDARDLFLDGDGIGPSLDLEPRGDRHPVFSSNRLSGRSTGISIRVLSIRDGLAHLAIRTATVADRCAELAGYCEGYPCEAGACGDGGGPLPPRELACRCSAAKDGAADRGLVLAAMVLLSAIARRLVRQRTLTRRS